MNKWTETPPNEPGWYWAISKRGYKACVVVFEYDLNNERLRVDDGEQAIPLTHYVRWMKADVPDNKTCVNCQYYRAGEQSLNPSLAGMYWCSNSKSEFLLMPVAPDNICKEFYKRGKKASLWMRALNWVSR